MAFGHASMPARKYVYGAREFLTRSYDETGNPLPRERFPGHDAAVEQLFQAHRFQNKLVELERKRRADCDAALLAAFSNLAQLQKDAEAASAVTETLRTQLSQSNSANRRVLSDKELVKRINAQKKVSAAAWRVYSSTRKAAFVDPAVKAALEAIDAAHYEATSQARSDAVAGGLYWATSLQVGPRVKKSGPPPRFKRWEGEGIISVQFQKKPDKTTPKVPVLDSKGNPRISPRSGKPMTAHAAGASLRTGEAERENTMCWIERPEPVVSYRRDPRHVVVHFRVGSAAKGEPLWASLPVIMHRPFPDGEIKWVHLSRRKIGTHWKWEIMFDVARSTWSDLHPAGRSRAAEGTVAVALGWRRIDGLIRVAEWVGSDGVSGSVRIPDDYVNWFQSLDGLRSVRDKMFDQSKAALVAWLRDQPNLPDEWKTRTATLAAWKSPARLAALVLWWRTNRLPNDAAIYNVCEGETVTNSATGRREYTGGRRQDKHLYDMECFRRERLLKWRADLYSNIAIDLSEQYRDVVIADIDWHAIAENPEPEDAADAVNKRFRGLAAGATLRDRLTKYMTEVTVDAAHITVNCHGCGMRCEPPARGRWVTCERCSVGTVDRAENAAKNMLNRVLGSAAPTSPSRTL